MYSIDTYMTSIQQHLKLALTQQYDTVNEFQESITHNSLDEDEIGYTHNLDDSLCIQNSSRNLDAVVASPLDIRINMEHNKHFLCK